MNVCTESALNILEQGKEISHGVSDSNVTALEKIMVMLGGWWHIQILVEEYHDSSRDLGPSMEHE